MPEAKALFLYSSKTATDTVRQHINEQSDFISVCTVQECPVEIRRNADSGRCGRRRGKKSNNVWCDAGSKVVVCFCIAVKLQQIYSHAVAGDAACRHQGLGEGATLHAIM